MVDEIVTDAAADADANSSNDTADASTEQKPEEVAAKTNADAAATTSKVAGTEDADAKDVTPDWPDDWRDKLAKGDDKVRKRLDRFQSPADVLKSWQSLEQNCPVVT